MSDYIAYLHHHSISRSPSLRLKGYTLAGAKRAATAEYGAGFLDHEIRIAHAADAHVVSARRIGAKRWSDTP